MLLVAAATFGKLIPVMVLVPVALAVPVMAIARPVEVLAPLEPELVWLKEA